MKVCPLIYAGCMDPNHATPTRAATACHGEDCAWWTDGRRAMLPPPPVTITVEQAFLERTRRVVEQIERDRQNARLVADLTRPDPTPHFMRKAFDELTEEQLHAALDRARKSMRAGLHFQSLPPWWHPGRLLDWLRP